MSKEMNLTFFSKLMLLVCSVPLCLSALSDTAQAQDRTFTELTTGKLYVPDHLTPRDGKVDLIVHFHAGDRIGPDAVDDHRINAAVAIVHFGGFSSAYRVPFEEPDRFAELLRDAEDQLQQQPGFENTRLGRVNLVSFSAGYGAVREILKNPDYVAQIHGVLLTDSMYAAYTGDPALKQVNPPNVDPFVPFAKLAVAGDKTFVVTHTYLEPGGYAGTHECAAYLVKQLGLETEAVPENEAIDPATGDLRLKERAVVNGLHVLGYHGDTGEDHGNHLRHTADWLPLLPLEFLPKG